jgi:hypothetical protein
MKKITKKEFNELIGEKKSKRGTLARMLTDLRVGEGLLIKRSEWIFKTSPDKAIHTMTWILRNNGMKIRYTCRLVNGKKAWAILRTE